MMKISATTTTTLAMITIIMMMKHWVQIHRRTTSKELTAANQHWKQAPTPTDEKEIAISKRKEQMDKFDAFLKSRHREVDDIDDEKIDKKLDILVQYTLILYRDCVKRQLEYYINESRSFSSESFMKSLHIKCKHDLKLRFVAGTKEFSKYRKSLFIHETKADLMMELAFF